MRFLDITNVQRTLEPNSYLTTIDTITDRSNIKYERLYIIFSENNDKISDYQITEDTYNYFKDNGIEIDYCNKYPYYQVTDVKNQLYRKKIKYSIILKTELIGNRDSMKKDIFFLGDISEKNEIEISDICANKLQEIYNIRVFDNEEEYQETLGKTDSIFGIDVKSFFHNI